MSNEATVHSSFRIQVGTFAYQTQPTVFQTDVSVFKGPVPGAFLASVDGVDVNLSELAQPGLCIIKNLDDANPITYGRFDSTTSVFYPMGKVLAGEMYVLRLADGINEEYAGTGTADVGNTTTFRIKAHNAACEVSVEAFET